MYYTSGINYGMLNGMNKPQVLDHFSIEDNLYTNVGYVIYVVYKDINGAEHAFLNSERQFTTCADAYHSLTITKIWGIASEHNATDYPIFFNGKIITKNMSISCKNM